MTLEEYISQLPKHIQFAHAIRFSRLVLPLWDNYAKTNALTYRDSVVGLDHRVASGLLKNTVDAVENYLSSNRMGKVILKRTVLVPLSEQFTDPMVALQDLDWDLPNEIEKTFYAIHNLLNSALGKEKTAFNKATLYVSINQAIDALTIARALSEAEIRQLLYST